MFFYVMVSLEDRGYWATFATCANDGTNFTFFFESRPIEPCRALNRLQDESAESFSQQLCDKVERSPGIRKEGHFLIDRDQPSVVRLCQKLQSAFPDK